MLLNFFLSLKKIHTLSLIHIVYLQNGEAIAVFSASHGGGWIKPHSIQVKKIKQFNSLNNQN